MKKNSLALSVYYTISVEKLCCSSFASVLMGTIQCVTVFMSCCVILTGNVMACHAIE